MKQKEIESILTKSGLKSFKDFIDRLLRRDDIRELQIGKYELEVVFIYKDQHYLVIGEITTVQEGVPQGAFFSFDKVEAIPEWEADIINNTVLQPNQIAGVIHKGE